MQIRVAVPPAPILTPADIPGGHPADDPAVAAAIEAATSKIDGLYGMLGRAIGPQTLALTLAVWNPKCIPLPLGPVINVVSVTYVDRDGVEFAPAATTFDWSDDTLSIRSGAWTWPAGWSGAVRIVIHYRAGFALENGTAAVPAAIKRAVMLMVQNAARLADVSKNSQILRSETVEDVGQFVYLDPDKAVAAIQSEIDDLLSSFMVYRV